MQVCFESGDNVLLKVFAPSTAGTMEVGVDMGVLEASHTLFFVVGTQQLHLFIA